MSNRFLKMCGSLAVIAMAACASAVSPASNYLTNDLQAGLAEAGRLAPPGAALALVSEGRSSFASTGTEWVGARPVSSRTLFQIASLTKPFTAMVILRLAEDRRLSLDDRASRWIDWLPADYAAVTIRQLLNHTSGVPRDLRQQNIDEFTLDEFRSRFLAAKPSFPVGERWEYSNTGYTLLSIIAERATGQDFGSLLERHIFRPAGMRNSRYRGSLIAAAGRAVGYDWVNERWERAPFVYSGFGNSGIESTSEDLARFAEALQGRKLLSAASYKEMLSPGRLSGGRLVSFPFRGATETSYGLGWFLTRTCGETVATHGGTIAGFSSNLSWVVDRDLSTIALSNGKSQADRIGIADKLAGAALRAALRCPA